MRNFETHAAGWLPVVGAIVTYATSVNAEAQRGANAARALEEVVVTARRREENLQDTPSAVAAIGAQTIEDATIQSISDYAGLIPNVTVIETQSSAFAFVLIRGITQVRNTESSIAYVVDGVLNTSPFGFSQALVDIQQIEVLKGPQGALYGRNAVGGAINITTKAPSNEFEGFVKASGGNGDFRGVQGALSGPIVEDTLLYRLTAYTERAEGWRDNITVGEPIDGFERDGARLRILYTPNDVFTGDLRITRQDNEGVGQAFVNIAPVFQSPDGNPLNGLIGGAVVSGAPGTPVAGLVGDPNVALPPPQGNILGIDDRTITNVSLKLDWDLPFATITSVSSLDEIDALLGGDQFPYTAAATLMNAQRRDTESFSQELRLTSPSNQRFRWLAGVYYSDTDFLFTANIETDPGDGSEPTRIRDVPAAGTTAFNSDINDNTSFSVFGQIAYDITDEVELSFALRYDDEERKQTVNTPDAFNAPFTNLFFGDTRTERFDAVQPKLTVRWQPNDNWTWYGTYAQAFRSGGFNPSGIGAEAQNLRDMGNLAIQAGIEDVFDQEDTEGIEFGFKSDLADGRVRVNGAAFHTRVDNQFTFNFIAALSNAQTVRNIDESEITGFEFDLQWAINDQHRVFAGVGYTDTEITRWGAEPQNEGNPLPFIPELTGNFTYEYRRDFRNDLAALLRADYQFIDEVTFVPAAFTARESVSLLNLRASIEVGDNWTVSVWGKNLTDEDYLSEYGNPPGFAYYAALRRWGAEATYRF